MTTTPSLLGAPPAGTITLLGFVLGGGEIIGEKVASEVQISVSLFLSTLPPARQ